MGDEPAGKEQVVTRRGRSGGDRVEVDSRSHGNDLVGGDTAADEAVACLGRIGDDQPGEHGGQALDGGGDYAQTAEVLPPIFWSPELVPGDDERDAAHRGYEAERYELEVRHMVSFDNVVAVPH